MTGRAGEVKNGELWLRCPFCGDSQRDSRKAHYSVNHKGLYYCLRCRVGGKLPLSAYLRLVVSGPLRGAAPPEADDWEELLDELEPGPGTSRRSALDRFHLVDPIEGAADAFLSRNHQGEIIGLALASPTRKTITGKRGIGFFGDELLSDAENPLRIVEGPYDVLTERDVCVFGLPNAKTMRRFKGHYVILCPDGDVWVDYTKRKTILDALAVKDGPVYLGVEVLEDGDDPDEIPYEDRRMVDAGRLVKRWAIKTRRARMERLLLP